MREEIRAGIADYEASRFGLNVLFIELGAIALGVWSETGEVWWGVGTLIGLFIAVNIPYIGTFILILLSLVWGGLMYALLNDFGVNIFIRLAMAAVVFYFALGINLAGRDY